MAVAVAEARAAVGSALRREDLEWSRSAAFRSRVERALDVCREAAAIGRVGVSYSGGKDSTCTLDLMRVIDPSTSAALFDSGDELPHTAEMARAVGAEIIAARLTMREMARYAGWWGYASPTDAGCPFDAKRILIGEPSESFVVRRELRVIVTGMRAEESTDRRLHAARGIYEGADRTWYGMPIARFELRDVWAYIASRELVYHPLYDAMAAARIPREHWRIGGALGGKGTGWGRYALLRRYAPAKWLDVTREFPMLTSLS